MCESCPHADAAKSGGAFDLMGEVSPDKKAVIEAFSDSGTCPKCGLTSKDFKESGRLGCPHCYRAFAAKLEPLVAKLHKGVAHTGKSPQGYVELEPVPDVQELRDQMERHVAQEEYEEAAVIRDRIRELESDSG